jgi:hypothetical protein
MPRTSDQHDCDIQPQNVVIMGPDISQFAIPTVIITSLDCGQSQLPAGRSETALYRASYSLYKEISSSLQRIRIYP